MSLPRVLRAVLSFAVLLGSSRGEDVTQILRQYTAQASSPQVLAAYMPWFGDKSHIDVGYSCHDPATLRRQIDQAVGMGISGFVVDWNGSRRPYTDKSFALMEQIASRKSFRVALLYNESEDAAHSTDEAIDDLDEAYYSYIGPNAAYHDAYLTYDGRPVIFIFPKGGHTDWNRLREYTSHWSAAPLLFYKDNVPSQYSNAFDGFYAWVHSGPQGWTANGSDWGKQYLENFYKKMQDKYPGKLVVAGAWPGFDDSKARWGQNRYMDPRCGKTLEDTLQLPRLHQEGFNPMPFLLIETWNDYEEGTAIERRTFSHCE
jgi:hypothetical protein